MIERERLDEVRRDRAAIERELIAAGAQRVGASMVCPYHDDEHASGGIHQGDNGAWMYTCFVGDCIGSADVFTLLMRRKNCGFSEAAKELCGEDQTTVDQPKKTVRAYDTIDDMEQAMMMDVPATRYIYTDPDSGLMDLIVLRFDPTGKRKTFRQCHQRADGKFEPSKKPGPSPIYNRSRLRSADEVYVVEGEKCVHSLHSVGVVATTSPGGSSASQKADWSPLAGKKRVVLWPDYDAAGLKYCKTIYAILTSMRKPPKEVVMLDPQQIDGLVEGQDVADYIAAIDDLPEKKRENRRGHTRCRVCRVSFTAGGV